MIFKSTRFNRFAAFAILFFGIGLFIVMLSFLIADENVQIENIPGLILIPGFFIVLGVFGIRSVKSAERHTKGWIISYVYRKKVVQLDENNVWKIVVQKKMLIGRWLFGDQILIKTKEGERILLNSKEMTDYHELLALLMKDFKKNVTVLGGTFNDE